MEKIDIGNDYSPLPYGRDESFGSGNGKTFREKFLKPFFIEHAKDSEVLYIDFSSIEVPPGASFLDEAFAGCIREKYTSKNTFKQKLKIKEHEDFPVTERIMRYIDEQ